MDWIRKLLTVFSPYLWISSLFYMLYISVFYFTSLYCLLCILFSPLPSPTSSQQLLQVHFLCLPYNALYRPFLAHTFSLPIPFSFSLKFKCLSILFYQCRNTKVSFTRIDTTRGESMPLLSAHGIETNNYFSILLVLSVLGFWENFGFIGNLCPYVLSVSRILCFLLDHTFTQKRELIKYYQPAQMSVCGKPFSVKFFRNWLKC